MQEVAVGNYRAFIAADGALSSCRDQLGSIGTHLDDMVISDLVLIFFYVCPMCLFCIITWVEILPYSLHLQILMC